MNKIRVRKIRMSLNVDVSFTKKEKDNLKARIRSMIKEVIKNKDVEVYTTYEEKE